MIRYANLQTPVSERYSSDSDSSDVDLPGSILEISAEFN